MMSPAQLPAQGRAMTLQAVSWGLEALVRAATPHYLQPHSQDSRQNRGRDGGGGRVPSLAVALPQTPLHATSVAWRVENGKASQGCQL